MEVKKKNRKYYLLTFYCYYNIRIYKGVKIFNKEIADREQNRQKRTRKYYLLSNLTTFNLQKSKGIHIFGKNKRIKIEEL